MTTSGTTGAFAGRSAVTPPPRPNGRVRRRPRAKTRPGWRAGRVDMAVFTAGAAAPGHLVLVRLLFHAGAGRS
jgi:hypothetical protein